MLLGPGIEATVTLITIQHQRQQGTEEDSPLDLWLPLHQECQDFLNLQDYQEGMMKIIQISFTFASLQVTNSANMLTTGLAMEKKKTKGGGSRGHSPARDY